MNVHTAKTNISSVSKAKIQGKNRDRKINDVKISSTSVRDVDIRLGVDDTVIRQASAAAGGKRHTSTQQNTQVGGASCCNVGE